MVDLIPLFQLEMRRWRGRRVLAHGVGLYVLSVALAAALQGLWAGDSFYNGTGTGLAERWFYSFGVSQGPCLASWSVLAGVATWRRLEESGLLGHALASRLRPAGLLAGAGAASTWPITVWLAGSCLFWIGISMALRAPAFPSVLFAHTLLLVQAVAFGMLGVSIGDWGSQSTDHGHQRWVALLLAAGGTLGGLTAVFAVGPLLRWCAQPGWLIYPALLVNPAVAIGTALNLDVLRTPWIYDWTPIPEYRFAYPAPAWTLALYAGCAVLALAGAARRLRCEP